MKFTGIWRHPAKQTNSYPKLMVNDNIMSGSINIRDTRLPLWAIIYTAINEGWNQVESGWSPTKRYNFQKDDLAHFIYCLLEQRGEFARLLLLLANAENKSDCWWEKRTHRNKVLIQLKRCINALNLLNI